MGGSYFFQLADGAVAVLTVLTLTFGGTWGLIVWASRRSRARAEEIKSEIRTEGQMDRSRIEEVEFDLSALQERVGQIDTRVEAGFRETDQEIVKLARSLETVARHSDVAKLSIDVSGLSSAQQAVGRQVSMLYEATLRREEGKKQ